MRYLVRFLMVICCFLTACTPSIPFQQAPTLQVQPIWSGAVGENHGLLLTPALQHNRLIAINAAGEVFVFNATDGELLQRWYLPVPITTGVAAIDNLFFVAGEDATLYAYSGTDQQLQWSFLLANVPYGAPVAQNNFVYIKNLDGNLYALKADTGHLVWNQHGYGAGISEQRASQVALGQQLVVASYQNGLIQAFDRATGQLRWQKIVESIFATPVLDAADNVYVATIGHYLYAYDKNGNALWQRLLATHNDLLLVQNVLYITDDDGQVWAIQAKTGQVVWVQTALQGDILSPPNNIGGFIVFGDHVGRVFWLGRTDGSYAASANMSHAPIAVKPLVLADRVYITDQNGLITSYQISW